jgi:bifunctional pyridoxal-dependent enzyme with beta-cystathionase and maltose regulon repressor activities
LFPNSDVIEFGNEALGGVGGTCGVKALIPRSPTNPVGIDAAKVEVEEESEYILRHRLSMVSNENARDMSLEEDSPWPTSRAICDEIAMGS